MMSRKFLPILIFLMKFKDFFVNIRNGVEKEAMRVEKRFRFVGSALLLTLFMLLSTFFPFDKSFIFVLIFVILGFILTYLSILEGIYSIEFYTLFFLPIVLTVSLYLFYFLFPARWLTRVPFVAFYAVSIYAVLLCSNIFNVGVEKSLQLYRAAFSVNFFYQTLVSFLLFSTLLSFKPHFLLGMIGSGTIVFLLSLQLFWTVKLEAGIDKMLLMFAGFVALIIAELTAIGSFLPIKTTIFSLFLTSSYYSLAGLINNFLDQRLFKETFRDYFFVWIIVFIITLL